MRRDHSAQRGSLHTLVLESELLRGNLLGDPSLRDVPVYIPEGHDGAGLPLLVDLVGFTAGGPAHVNWKNFGENVPERLDRLIATGAMPPAVVAFPDCFTRLGGNQYINSEALGPWEDVLIEEVVPLVEQRFGCGGDGRRGVFGKSSGGYGAIVHALRRPDCWAAAACHSGDMGFELCYLREMPAMLRAIAKKGSIEAFIKDFEAGPKWKGDDIHLLMTLAMCATYDPDPAAFCGVRLPVDPETCEVIEERWQNWRRWDPVTMADSHGANLKKLKALWIDCGDVDQYDLVYGARRLHRKLKAAGIDHVYEEFADNHSAVDYRMDMSLPFLVKALG
ncbi:alpha/beta hydrolase [Pelagibius sp.]|uniref:alpha/beta hydrolase n=1 Tax=Pelagibius sp. TaxID=1931238 RepID=UPI003B50C320